MGAAIGHHHRFGADYMSGLGSDTGKSSSVGDGFGDGVLDRREVGVTSEELRNRDEILHFLSLGDDHRLVAERFHEKPHLGHVLSLEGFAVAAPDRPSDICRSQRERPSTA